VLRPWDHIVGGYCTWCPDNHHFDLLEIDDHVAEHHPEANMFASNRRDIHAMAAANYSPPPSPTGKHAPAAGAAPSQEASGFQPGPGSGTSGRPFAACAGARRDTDEESNVSANSQNLDGSNDPGSDSFDSDDKREATEPDP
jgi:hypothetical protein